MRSEFQRRAAMLAAMLGATVYLFYRAAFTMNLTGPYAILASVTLYVAEAYGCFLMFLYFFQIWRIEEPAPVPPLEGRTVDVYIPTYNEDPELLRGTISAALALDYPHETWVLDDGKRDSVKELCAELGAKYLIRPNNMHAKAGNLNHALEITTGEFVVIFDADHVAERTFITRLLGYFADEKLAFVQTPHSFYNFDNFQAELNYRTHHYWEEGQLFYNCTQPGKNHWNGVSFCGSAAMFRRSALEDVGLVATETITEDMQTGIRLHGRGWKSLFVNERLVSGQAAPDITTFNTQRLRWGEGNLGIFAFDNPLTMKGLTFAQRLCYLGSMLSWTTGVQKLVLYVSPMLMLFTGVAPIRELTWTLGLITTAYLIAVWTAVKVSSNGYGNLVGIELTHMASFWTQIQSTYRAIFKRKKTKFVVTSKRGKQSGKGNTVRRMIAPQCWYIAGSAASIAWAGSRYVMGLSNDLTGLVVCGSLLFVHCLFALSVIRRALKPGCRRFSWRHPCSAHVAYKMTTADGTVVTGQGITKDLNERGAGILVFEKLPDAKPIELTITAGGETLTATGEIRIRQKVADVQSSRDGDVVGYRYGVLFHDLTTKQLNTLWSISVLYAVARQYEWFHRRQYPDSPTAALDPSQRTYHLPITLHSDTSAEPFRGTTETMDRTTATILLDRACNENERVRMDLGSPTGAIHGDALVTRVEAKKVGARTLYLHALKFEHFEEQSRGMLQSVLMKGDDRRGEDLVRLHPRKAPRPLAKPMAITAGVAASVTIVVFTCFQFVERDDILLAQIAEEGVASEKETARVDHLIEDIRKSGPARVDEDRVLRLREAVTALDREDDAMYLDRVLADADVRTVFALFQKAQSLEGLNRSIEASPVFDEIVERLGEFPTRGVRADVLLAAARNKANLQNFDRALAYFEKLADVGGMTDVARREYAGLLAANGQAAEAVERLEKLERTLADRYLLASLYLSLDDYPAARREYDTILFEAPDEVDARRGLGNLALWSKDYTLAAEWYAEVLAVRPHDDVARLGRAQALLWDGHYDPALVAWRGLLTDEPSRREWWTFYLDAAAGADRAMIIDADRQMLRQLFASRGMRADDARYITRLGDALDRAKLGEETAIVLGSLLEQDPANRKLRLRLADKLNEVGQYQRAEVHYQALLGDTPNGPRPTARESFARGESSTSRSGTRNTPIRRPAIREPVPPRGKRWP